MIASSFIHGFPPFLSHFAAAAVLVFLFIVIYVRITPYREIALIREGNTAAAISLSGALLGYTVALASAIANSVGFADMVLWGGIALAVQLLAYLITRMLLPDLISDIPQNRTASGVFLAALSLAMGLINAACMTY
ncbi:DUF350 domain-containing protein [Undibacterium luofuense]|uniref:DUF350 domain-containing protein n=1 Tax=Undibacterium luofuense TaxID=2828733 RepID=A0A941I8G5_9BURK|nr:DUF350 domain-containing protein [Undibacterium luofuense]MBR7783849.1 DUF350 domain-containing protein [Undibacterium luofuense]